MVDYIIVLSGFLLCLLFEKYRSEKDSLLINCFSIAANLSFSSYLIFKILKDLEFN